MKDIYLSTQTTLIITLYLPQEFCATTEYRIIKDQKINFKLFVEFISFIRGNSIKIT